MSAKGKAPTTQGVESASTLKIQNHSQIMESVINNAKKLNWKKLANVGEEDKLKRMDYTVVTALELKKAIDEKHGIYTTLKDVFIYNGCYWSKINKETFKKLLGRIAVKYGMSKVEGEYYQNQQELLTQVVATCYNEIPDVDINVVNINLLNGTLEINKGVHKLKPFDKNDYLHYQLSYDFDESAECPMWLKFLDEVLPEKKAQQVLAEYIGYLFIRNGSFLKIEKVLALIGGGSNGKGVVNEVVTAIVGKENTSTYSLEQITDSTGYWVSEIENKLLNFPTESSSKLNVEVFKRIASGEPLSARPIREKPYTVTQYAKQIFSLNKSLQAKDTTHAHYRRYIILPFDRTFEDDEKDLGLSKRIIDKELSGIMNWILKGLAELIKNKKFTESESSKRALEDFKIDTDSVMSFIVDKNYYIIDDKTKFGEVFDRYVQYCSEDKLNSVSKKTFGQRVVNIKIKGEKIQKKTVSNARFLNVKTDDF